MSETANGTGRRVALFVDGDNIAPAQAGAVLRAASALGSVQVRRVYARAAGLSGWDATVGYRMIHAGGAKNGTDLLMCIEAVDLACRGGIDAFAIASDDRDFGHLAHWLRERGCEVLGVGTARATPDWRAACSSFVLLDAVAPASGTPPQGIAVQRAADEPSVDECVRRLILAEGKGGSMPVGVLGCRMGSKHGVRLTDIGTTGWRAYLASKPTIYRLDPKGPRACVGLV